MFSGTVNYIVHKTVKGNVIFNDTNNFIATTLFPCLGWSLSQSICPHLLHFVLTMEHRVISLFDILCDITFILTFQ